MCGVCEYTSVGIMSELKKNILSFGYRMNFKYEGMLVHSFDRFYVVTKFILPSVNDLNFSPIDFYAKCIYLNEYLSSLQNAKQHISNLKLYCEKIVPFIDFYKKQISSYNHTAHKILTNAISLMLKKFPRDTKENRSIIASLVTGFIGLAFEGIPISLHKKDKKALGKAFILWKIK